MWLKIIDFRSNKPMKESIINYHFNNVIPRSVKYSLILRRQVNAMRRVSFVFRQSNRLCSSFSQHYTSEIDNRSPQEQRVPGRLAHFPVRPRVVSPTFSFAPSRFSHYFNFYNMCSIWWHKTATAENYHIGNLNNLTRNYTS